MEARRSGKAQNGKMKKLIYIARPYSGDMEGNIKRAEEVSIQLIREGYHVITPHKNTAGYEKYENDKITYETWMALSLNILSRCDAIYVMNGSTQSNGVQREMEFAKLRNIEILNEKKNEWVVYSERELGVTYTVKLKFGFFECSCPAFKYRKGECKHIKKIKMRLAGEFQQNKLIAEEEE